MGETKYFEFESIEEHEDESYEWEDSFIEWFNNEGYRD